MKLLLSCLVLAFLPALQDAAKDPLWVTFEGAAELPGSGKHIVLLAGDEEYRSEEALPMLAKILAVHHGFKTTVLFSTDPETGEIDPMNQTNVPGMHLLTGADMLICAWRFRELPDADMEHFVNFVHSGRPVLGLRTATHAFDYTRNKESVYKDWTWRNDEWDGGFGRQILGETWVAHHGAHGSQATRGVVNPEEKEHPILKGLAEVFGPTDVYTVRELPDDARVLLFGEVVDGMDPTDKALEGEKNDPMMPLIWTRRHQMKSGTKSRAICSTIGSSTDMESAGLRRVLVNACYWGLGLEDKIPGKSKVDYVGEYKPTPFGFDRYKRGVKAAEHALAP